MSRSQERAMRKAITNLHYEQQIDLVCKAMASRGKIIDALIEDIIQLIQSACLQRSVMQLPNCQTFVIDAMKAMGIKNRPKMTGKLSEYFEGLKKGSR